MSSYNLGGGTLSINEDGPSQTDADLLGELHETQNKVFTSFNCPEENEVSVQDTQNRIEEETCSNSFKMGVSVKQKSTPESNYNNEILVPHTCVVPSVCDEKLDMAVKQSSLEKSEDKTENGGTYYSGVGESSNSTHSCLATANMTNDEDPLKSLKDVTDKNTVDNICMKQTSNSSKQDESVEDVQKIKLQDTDTSNQQNTHLPRSEHRASIMIPKEYSCSKRSHNMSRRTRSKSRDNSLLHPVSDSEQNSVISQLATVATDGHNSNSVLFHPMGTLERRGQNHQNAKNVTDQRNIRNSHFNNNTHLDRNPNRPVGNVTKKDSLSQEKVGQWLDTRQAFKRPSLSSASQESRPRQIQPNIPSSFRKDEQAQFQPVDPRHSNQSRQDQFQPIDPRHSNRSRQYQLQPIDPTYSNQSRQDQFQPIDPTYSVQSRHDQFQSIDPRCSQQFRQDQFQPIDPRYSIQSRQGELQPINLNIEKGEHERMDNIKTPMNTLERTNTYDRNCDSTLSHPSADQTSCSSSFYRTSDPKYHQVSNGRYNETFVSNDTLPGKVTKRNLASKEYLQQDSSMRQEYIQPRDRHSNRHLFHSENRRQRYEQRRRNESGRHSPESVSDGTSSIWSSGIPPLALSDRGVSVQAPANSCSSVMSASPSHSQSASARTCNSFRTQHRSTVNDSTTNNGVFSDTGPNCRICHEGDSNEVLISPCYCAGSVGLIHISCLQRWLGASNNTSCEICRFQFSIQRRSQPFREFLRNPGTRLDRRNVICDCVTFCTITPLTLATVWMCMAAALKFFKVSGWEQICLIVLCASLLIIYSIWLTIALRHNFRLWKDWQMFHQEVTLLGVPLDNQGRQNDASTPAAENGSHINTGGVQLQSIQISVTGALNLQTRNAREQSRGNTKTVTDTRKREIEMLPSNVSHSTLRTERSSSPLSRCNESLKNSETGSCRGHSIHGNSVKA